MGHRASVCYWDGSKGSVHYSHWGALDTCLIDQISEDTPFGSESTEPEFVNEMLASFENMSGNTEISGHLTEASADTPVDPERYAVVDSLQEWAERVNALHHECAYLVDITEDEWEVRAYAPIFWRGLEILGRTGYALIEAGEDAHAMWDGINADSWEEFLEEIPKEPEFIVKP